MKYLLVAILALTLCGCGAIKQPEAQSNPGQMATGNWEFVLAYGGTQNGYVESSIASTSTPGTYNDHGKGSKLFKLDTGAYFADPAAGGGYELGATVSSFTLVVNSKLQVHGTLARNGEPSITFTGNVVTGGTTMTGTFNDGEGHSGQFAGSVAQALDGDYADLNAAIDETIAGNVITEGSQSGSGNYDLAPAVGNFAALLSDIPEGGNGSVVFWNNTGVCTGNQCAVWHDVSTGKLWILMKNPNTSVNKVVDVLDPQNSGIN